MKEAAFNRDDEIRVRAILELLSEKSKFQQTLGHLVTQWRRFVESIELGYNQTLYDYENSLSIRNNLSRIEIELSQEGRVIIRNIIDPLDSRFLDATIQISNPIRNDYATTTNWWWYRIPNVISGTLEEDLRVGGFL